MYEYERASGESTHLLINGLPFDPLVTVYPSGPFFSSFLSWTLNIVLNIVIHLMQVRNQDMSLTGM